MSKSFAAIATELRQTIEQAQDGLKRLKDAETSLPPQADKWSKKEILRASSRLRLQ